MVHRTWPTGPSAQLSKAVTRLVTNHLRVAAAWRVSARPAARAARAVQCHASMKALIFDCDGVILESEDLHRRAYNATFRHFKVKCGETAAYSDSRLLRRRLGAPRVVGCQTRPHGLGHLSATPPLSQGRQGARDTALLVLGGSVPQDQDYVPNALLLLLPPGACLFLCRWAARPSGVG